MDPPGPTSQLLAALRGEMVRKVERTGNPRKAGKARTVALGHDRQALRNELTEIARQADLADEGSQRMARRRMVRAMLLWEFGPELREHAEWRPMLEAITQALEGSPLHLAAFSLLIDKLRKQD
ncbi:hypothetical protein [Solilutibacter pythonis]|uniref:hypothetical protein n=1 Tax=Solilutibacter pythonis TaxID=2483112 RepID=UPI00131475A5|nr:hypothetical protein [Lysobacter pythonis]